jgi:hypothetical protein
VQSRYNIRSSGDSVLLPWWDADAMAIGMAAPAILVIVLGIGAMSTRGGFVKVSKNSETRMNTDEHG